jgi:23S rRNA (uracil1939-C5)-methyltransferase
VNGSRRVPHATFRETDLTIVSVAAGGDGVGRADDGVVVFVPRTAPGDRGTVRFATRRRGRFAHGELLHLAEASPARVEPQCPHYTVDRCGGCQLQHLAYPEQLDAKAGIVRDALTRIGRRTVDAPAVRPSPSPWRYRRKLTLALRRRAGGRWIAGLHPYDDPSAIFALTDCPITDTRVLEVWRSVMNAADHLPDEPSLRAAVRVLDDGRATLTVEGGRAWPDAAVLFDAVPALDALWWRPDPPGTPRQLLASRTDASIGASFAQINAPIGVALHDAVVARALAFAPSTVVDAYAGVGDTATALAGKGVRVTAIELDADASRWTAARLPATSRAIAARVEDALPAALPADVVIVNPPRTGLAESVTDTLEGPGGPGVVLYVSCDPATLARDVARLSAYEITALESFDMFPQTAHVETLCQLVRR